MSHAVLGPWVSLAATLLTLCSSQLSLIAPGLGTLGVGNSQQSGRFSASRHHFQGHTPWGEASPSCLVKSSACLPHRAHLGDQSSSEEAQLLPGAWGSGCVQLAPGQHVCALLLAGSVPESLSAVHRPLVKFRL